MTTKRMLRLLHSMRVQVLRFRQHHLCLLTMITISSASEHIHYNTIGIRKASLRPINIRRKAACGQTFALEFGQKSTPSSIIHAARGEFSAFAGTPSPFGATKNATTTTTPAASTGRRGSGFQRSLADRLLSDSGHPRR